MKYDNLIGVSLNDAQGFVEKHGISGVFTQSKDRYNDYENKRIILVREIEKGKLELLYTGFPPYKE